MRLTLLLGVLGALLAVFPSSALANHGYDLDCTDFNSQREVQNHLATHPGDPDGLSNPNNGRPCEALPCPCGATVGTTAPASPPPPPPLPSVSMTPLGGPTSATGRVVRVIDGATLRARLTTGESVTVRLIGVDTPRTRSRRRVECGARQAAARMRALAFRNGRGRTVNLRTDPDPGETDRFGRLLAYVSSAGVDFGRSMIASGWARSSGGGFGRAARYRSAQASAKAARRGAWRQCGGNFHRVR
jgi:endonuclease YncB( thermonuclease family)